MFYSSSPLAWTAVGPDFFLSCAQYKRTTKRRNWGVCVNHDINIYICNKHSHFGFDTSQMNKIKHSKLLLEEEELFKV